MATKLKGAFLSITNKCNLNCRHCYQKTAPKNELKTQEWLRITDELKKLGAEKINFTGGEPFVHKDFWKILDYACKKGFETEVFTNGTLLDEKKIRKLEKYRTALSFNLETLDKKAADLCKKHKIAFEINIPVTKKNVGDIENILKFCRKIGARRARLIPLVLEGNARNFGKEKPSKGQINKLNAIIKKYPYATLCCKKCGAGINYLTIQSDGKVTPCTLNRNIVGDIKNQPLSEILENSRKYGRKFNRACLR